MFGLPTTGFGGPERDLRKIIYSVPEMLVLVLTATLLIGLPLVVARLARSRPATMRAVPATPAS